MPLLFLALPLLGCGSQRELSQPEAPPSWPMDNVVVDATPTDGRAEDSDANDASEAPAAPAEDTDAPVPSTASDDTDPPAPSTEAP